MKDRKVSLTSEFDDHDMLEFNEFMKEIKEKRKDHQTFLDVISEIICAKCVPIREFDEFKEKIIFRKEIGDMSSKIAYCLAQIVPMSDKIETLSRSNMEIKWDCKRMDEEIITRADKDNVIMIESRFRDYTPLTKFEILENSLIEY